MAEIIAITVIILLGGFIGWLIYLMCQPGTGAIITPQLDKYIERFKNCKTKDDFKSLHSDMIENKDFFEKREDGYYHLKIVAKRNEIIKLLGDIKAVYKFLDRN